MIKNTTDKIVLDRFKRLLRQHGVPLHRLVLFGSRARGDEDKELSFDLHRVFELRQGDDYKRIDPVSLDEAREAMRLLNGSSRQSGHISHSGVIYHRSSSRALFTPSVSSAMHMGAQ
jgi:hypothetical protein